MIRPTPRLLALTSAGLLVAALPALGAPWQVWAVYVGALTLATLTDAVLILPRRRLTATVRAPATLFVGAADTLVVELATPRWRRPTRAELLVDMSDTMAPQGPALALIPAGGATDAALPLLPLRRGTATFRRLWVRWSGPLGLVRRDLSQPLSATAAIVPDVRAIRALTLRLAGPANPRAGVHLAPMPGFGTDLESLRDFQAGLDARTIDWKASARRRRLVCREYRAERCHDVLLGFDTGRLMSEPLQGIPRLDHAVNAGLLLGWVCLKTGDRVGFFGFDARVRTWVEPGLGVRTFARLRERTAELDYASIETSFPAALADAAARLRRRALVVLFTDAEDSVAASLLLAAARRLSERHLVLVATLRDPQLLAVASARPATLGALNRAVVAADLQRERSLVHLQLRRQGVLALDAFPKELSAALVRRYLDLRRRERL